MMNTAGEAHQISEKGYNVGIIDFRLRPNTPTYMEHCSGPAAEKLWARPKFGPYPGEQSFESWLAEVGESDVTLGVFTGRQVGDPSSPTVGFTNDYIAECVEKSDGKLIGFAGVDPGMRRVATKELRRAVGELGMRGVSVDPEGFRQTPDHRQFYPIYETAAELEIPVVVTVGPVCGRFADPWAMDIVAEDFPEVTFVMSHGTYPHVTELIALAYRRSNIYLEASIYYALPGSEPFLEAAGTVLQDQVVYASAFPFNPITAYERFAQFEIGDDALGKIMFGNAARILGLDAPQSSHVDDHREMLAASV
ncbi:MULTISPECIES: amidohydrolase family protein [unclassified Microbacterium]|uniref:amidohydrolase family protein n=1 Tax=unclassified Microbacterium TaxID=2609290 RepID=UPI0012FD7241|nr:MULTISPECIES: amidohydrolase family protein [unclassified Microbacterium]